MTRLALALPLLPLLGCPTKDTVACTQIAIASVVVNVSDEAGEPLDATVTYTVDGGDPVACESFSAGQYTCGYEVAGDLTVHVLAAGYQDFEETVTVGMTEDGCHVSSETVDAVLYPEDVDCTDVEVPSVHATVVGSGGEALTGVAVTWTHADSFDPQPCDPYSGGWACGWEEAGTLVVTATADEHAEKSATVEVSADECHVLTEDVELALDLVPPEEPE